jgi:hypothetical protein
MTSRGILGASIKQAKQPLNDSFEGCPPPYSYARVRAREMQENIDSVASALWFQPRVASAHPKAGHELPQAGNPIDPTPPHARSRDSVDGQATHKEPRVRTAHLQ